MDPFKEVKYRPEDIQVTDDKETSTEDIIESVNNDINKLTKNKRFRKQLLSETLSPEEVKKMKLIDRLRKIKESKIVR